MERAISLVLLILCLVFLVVGCDKTNYINATIDIASSVNFRCEVYVSASEESYNTNENSSVELFQRCYDNKNKATKLKGQVGVGSSYIKLNFVGDCVDNAPTKEEKADYGRFVIFSNDTVRFEYDTASQYYQFDSGFYDGINTYLFFFAEKQQ